LEISSSSLSFRISLIEVDALKAHEEVVDSIVDFLANDMLTEGKVRDPLIVDQEECVILDGMHRYSSLKSLKCRFIPCCLVDYDSPLIRVGAWFRLFAVDQPESLAEKVLTENKLRYSRERIKFDDMTCETQTIILTSTETAFSLTQPLEPVEQARTAVLVEKSMAKLGHVAEYLSEIVAIQNLRSGKRNLVISLPVFTKRQIRDLGQRGLLLPHKVTRHVIPSRPLHINVPLQILKDATISQQEADRKLGNLLAERQVERKDPGSIVDGRRYEEELLVFSS